MVRAKTSGWGELVHVDNMIRERKRETDDTHVSEPAKQNPIILQTEIHVGEVGAGLGFVLA